MNERLKYKDITEKIIGASFDSYSHPCHLKISANQWCKQKKNTDEADEWISRIEG